MFKLINPDIVFGVVGRDRVHIAAGFDLGMRPVTIGLNIGLVTGAAMTGGASAKPAVRAPVKAAGATSSTTLRALPFVRRFFASSVTT